MARDLRLHLMSASVGIDELQTSAVIPQYPYTTPAFSKFSYVSTTRHVDTIILSPFLQQPRSIDIPTFIPNLASNNHLTI